MIFGFTFRMLLLATLSLVLAGTATAQDRKAAVRVEPLPIADLPLVISMPVLDQSGEVSKLDCSVANYADEAIMGSRLVLLIADHDNHVKEALSWTQKFRLPAASTSEFTFRLNTKLETNDGDHLLLAVEEVFGHDSIWQVTNVAESAMAFDKGDVSVPAKVQRIANKFDSRMPISPY
jgi:hypothetical protein